MGQIPNGSVNSCSNCHINPNGGGTRNAFGQAVEAGLIGSNVDWGPTLAALDSDGDGFTNGTELQDPNGTWSSGSQGNSALVSKPGDASSVPATANNSPVLAAIGDKSADEGALLSFTLTATDADDDDVSFTVSGAPSGSSLPGATFSQSGTYNVTFIADDGEDTDSETITITVDDLNQPPELSAIGDQQRRLTGPAAVGQIHACQLHIVDAPEIDRWRVVVEFDPAQLRYFDGSFSAGDFLNAIDATASGEDGSVSLTVSSEDASSGNGELGALSFEILEGFGGSADVAVVEVELSREGDIVDS